MKNIEVLNKRGVAEQAASFIKEKGYKNATVNLMLIRNGRKLDQSAKDIQEAIKVMMPEGFEELQNKINSFIVENHGGSISLDQYDSVAKEAIGDDYPKFTELSKEYQKAQQEFFQQEFNGELILDKLDEKVLEKFDVEIELTNLLIEFV